MKLKLTSPEVLKDLVRGELGKIQEPQIYLVHQAFCFIVCDLEIIRVRDWVEEAGLYEKVQKHSSVVI